MIGTEIAFRLGPGTLDEARAIAATLAELATDAHEHVLFCDDQIGEYGCLAVWATAADADAFIASTAVTEHLRQLSARMDKPLRVRRYVMEYQRTAPSGA
jgi:hypothetical protein